MHCDFSSKFHPAFIIVQRLIIQDTENQFFLFITASDADPHPFSDSCGLVGKLNFNEISAPVMRLLPICITVPIQWFARLLVTAGKPAVWRRSAFSPERFVLIKPPETVRLHCGIARIRSSAVLS